MQRYFGNIINNKAILTDGDIFHISTVMRMKVGDEFEFVSDSKVYLAQVTSFNPFNAQIVKEINENHELKNKVTLAFAPLKGDHFDLVLQKATELGVDSIVIMNTSRTVKVLDKETFVHKKDRYLKILKEASEQSKRNKIPSLDCMSINDLGRLNATIKLVAYEEMAGDTSSFINELNKIKENDSIIIAIGPEGGFSEKEVSFLNSLGYVNISLGKRILRAETASMYALSVIGAYLEK